MARNKGKGNIPCKYFRENRCYRGQDCGFSHEIDSSSARSRPEVSGRGDAQSLDGTSSATTQSQLRAWRFDIPLQPSTAGPLYARLGAFLQHGQSLVAGEPGTAQEVVTALASDGGLHRIGEFVKRDYSTLPDGHLSKFFEAQAIPFFRLLSHKNVDRSAFLEGRLATIYTFLFGPNGQRAVDLLTAAVRYLKTIIKPGATDNDRTATECTLLVFTRIMDVNATAQVTEPFKAIVGDLTAFLEPPNAETEPFSRAALSSLRKIRQRLSLGESIPMAGASAATGPKPTFATSRDLPGQLSDGGPRHDNDFDSIKDIKIMPTLQEILASRNEYLPTFDPAEWHVPGVAGLLDRQFRLVREDTVGQLRDAAKFELEKLQDPVNTDRPTDPKLQGARTFVYKNVLFENFGFDSVKGLEFAVSFDQPTDLRGRSEQERAKAWEDSRRLENDALVCLIDAHGSATFLMISTPLQPSTQRRDKSSQTHDLHKRYSRSERPDRACAVVRFVEYNKDISKQVLSFFDSANRRVYMSMSLVEFPGVLVPAFLPTLAALQKMSVSLDLPFTDLILQNQNAGSVDNLVPPPSYAVGAGFRFDLRAATTNTPSWLKVKVDGSVDDDFNMRTFKQNTPLDEGQAEALISSLTRSFAITQGPPGTGKSFTGIALIKVLLKSKPKADAGPIILVSYTNHALDQMLEHLVDAGVTQIIRVGSRSKSERLSELNIRVVASKSSMTKAEKSEKWKLKDAIGKEGLNMMAVLSQIGALGSQKSVEEYLSNVSPPQWKQLFGLEDEEGFTLVDHHPETRLMRWLHGELYPPRHTSDSARALGDILDTDLRIMPIHERRIVHQHWVWEIRQRLENGLAQSLKNHHDLKAALELVRTELDLRAIAQADIVGLTTSGLARNLTLLRKLDSKILVSEEAGEIQESHLLTALLPSLEHVVLLGDHLQLRPQVQNFALSSASQEGKQYCLDISLFERLVKPLITTAPALPFSTLSVQRRMHPQISELIRAALYPKLLDAPNVAEYPQVSGMRRRLFWLDHNHREDGSGFNSSQSTSKTNEWEADMTASLVRHIVRQGVYKPSEVAVLTPYLGQLRVLRDKLRSYYEITLSEGDSVELNEGVEEFDDTQSEPSTSEHANGGLEKKAPTSNIVRGTLMDAVRLSTVDNFQGEEAKVIVISLVRCNEKHNAGFLRIENRINVLISRAMHGMYIIGNAATAATVPMWEQIIQMLSPDRVGDKLELCCPRHPEKLMEAGEPEELFKLAPAGGCEELCNQRLDCGHSCPQHCHSEVLHKDVYCQKDCSRALPNCEHACPNKCGDPCPQRCNTTIAGRILELGCGHEIENPTCWQTQNAEKIVCKELVRKVVPGCEHVALLSCHVDQNGPKFRCQEVCGEDLTCGHRCKKRCHNCNERADGSVIKSEHGDCSTVCGRDYTLCKHSCTQTCHAETPCPPCDAPCDVQCSHSRCSKRCNEPCMPCAEEVCASRCEHVACEMPCAAPCDWVPCSKRCSKTLSCGCRCPCACSEPCPDAEYCQKCGSAAVLEQQVEYLEFKEYREIDVNVDPIIVLSCGHIFTIGTLDGLMKMSDHYELDAVDMPVSIKSGPISKMSTDGLPSCPKCRGTLRNIGRYGRIVRRALLDESTKKFISSSNAEYLPLLERFLVEQDELNKSLDNAKLVSRGVRLTGSREQQIIAIRNGQGFRRYGSIFHARRRLLEYVGKVQETEQPFRRVRDMVEAVRRKKAGEGYEIAAFDFDQSLLQTRSSLLGLALLLRCDLAIVSDVLAVREKTPMKGVGNEGLEVSFGENRADCDRLIADANQSSHKAFAGEGHIFWARFAALELHASPNDTDPMGGMSKTQLKEAALAHLEAAEEVCRVMAGSTSAFSHEIEPTRRMLNQGVFYSTVSKDEMRAVIAAMATEFSGTGHWYTCVNGHPFTVGECGMPMERARCPECGEQVGGSHHVPVAGVQRAEATEQ